MKPKTKFLTVVWGDAYIKRFSSLSLPSLLAPGNLPVLAAATDLEIVILTARKDIATFEKYEAFTLLREICNVKFIDIDDLITTSIYGVTLTLAYARAIMNCGTDMINTHFVFMNADFVLADGSLQNLSKKILDGRSIIVAPSARVTAESIEPILHDTLEESSHTLSIPPRKMVSLALDNLHPTTLAKIMNQNLCHTINPNQFFWLVDEHTMLGRYHLIFMLCLKPERELTKINSYCDYGFIPEMCPSGEITIMGDSDDYFMLELQARKQELFLLQFGRLSVKKAARNLGEWTTAEHRRMADYDVVLHSHEIPHQLGKTRREADEFIEKIRQKLPAPVPHEFHYHWVQGVQAWKHNRNSQGLSTSPPELDTSPQKFSHLNSYFINIKHTIKFYWYNLLSFSQRKTIGAEPFVTILHPDWIDYQFLRDSINSIPNTDETRLLIIASDSEMVKIMARKHHHVEIIHPIDFLGYVHSPSGNHERLYTHIFIYICNNDFKQIGNLIEACQSCIQPNGEYQIFIHHLFDEVSSMLTVIDKLFLRCMKNKKFCFIGGRLKYINKSLFNFTRYLYFHYSNYALIWILPLLLPLTFFTFFLNLYLRTRFPSDSIMDCCSSFLVRIKNKPDKEVSETG